MQSDLLMRVFPAALDAPARLGGQGGSGVRRILDAVFGDPAPAWRHGPNPSLTDPRVQQTIGTISPLFPLCLSPQRLCEEPCASSRAGVRRRPVVIGLVLSALVGSVIGWFLFAHLHCRKDSSPQQGCGYTGRQSARGVGQREQRSAAAGLAGGSRVYRTVDASLLSTRRWRMLRSVGTDRAGIGYSIASCRRQSVPAGSLEGREQLAGAVAVHPRLWSIW